MYELKQYIGLLKPAILWRLNCMTKHDWNHCFSNMITAYTFRPLEIAPDIQLHSKHFTNTNSPKYCRCLIDKLMWLLEDGLFVQHASSILIATDVLLLKDCMIPPVSLRWCHNGRDGVSNHQPHDCLLNRLFRRRSTKTSKLSVTDRWIPRTNGQ